MIRSLFYIFLCVVFVAGLTGCQEPTMEEKATHFIQESHKLFKEFENGNAYLSEVRELEGAGEVSRSKVISAISVGVDITQSFHEVIDRADVPTDLEPLKKDMLKSLEIRLDAYQLLDHYYDFQVERYLHDGDALLTQSFELMMDVKERLNQYERVHEL